MQLAPTLGPALQVLRRDFHLHDRGAVPYVADMGYGRFALGYTVPRHQLAGIAATYDFSLAVGMSLLKALCGRGFNAHSVSFAHAAPRDARPWRRVFGAPVAFDAAHTQIEFDAAWLEHPLAGAEVALRAALQHAARPFDAGDMPRSLGDRARSVAQALLMSGGLPETRIADELGLTCARCAAAWRPKGRASSRCWPTCATSWRCNCWPRRGCRWPRSRWRCITPTWPASRAASVCRRGAGG